MMVTVCANDRWTKRMHDSASASAKFDHQPGRTNRPFTALLRQSVDEKIPAPRPAYYMRPKRESQIKGRQEVSGERPELRRLRHCRQDGVDELSRGSFAAQVASTRRPKRIDAADRVLHAVGGRFFAQIAKHQHGTEDDRGR